MSADSTVEFAHGTLPEELPLPGRYEVNPGRFVVEAVVRMTGKQVLRGRLACAGGHLVLGPAPELSLDLAAGSLRVNVFGLARTFTGEGGLCASKYPIIRFRSTEMTVTGDRAVEVTGHLDVLGAAREIHLSGRLTYVDGSAVVLWVTGVVPPRPPEGGSGISRWAARRRVRIELAAEFGR